MQKRLFLALDPSGEACAQLRQLCCGLPGARWNESTQFHLTLVFIGEVEGSVFLDIRDDLASITATGFTLQFQGVGFFPPRGEPRVLWAGLTPCPALNQLQRKLRTRLVQMGVQLENRKFSPHLTLARLRSTPPEKVGRFLAAHALFKSVPFQVDSFTLYSSILGKKGAVYRPEQRYDLLAADPQDA